MGSILYYISAGIYLLELSNRTRCEICSKLTIKTPERRYWHRSDVFIVNFEHISHLVLVFLLLTLNMHLPTGISLQKCLTLLFGSPKIHRFCYDGFTLSRLVSTKGYLKLTPVVKENNPYSYYFYKTAQHPTNFQQIIETPSVSRSEYSSKNIKLNQYLLTGLLRVRLIRY